MSTEASQGEIRSFEDRRFQAMVAADVPTLERLLGDDLVYTHSSASGDTAVVAGQARIELLGASGSRVLNLRYLDVWVRRAAGWQMVAWQSTPMPA